MYFLPKTLSTIPSPVDEAFKLLNLCNRNEFIFDLSQGMLDIPPAEKIRKHLLKVVESPEGAFYTERRGKYKLRLTIAEAISKNYNAQINFNEVLVTAGANQGFCNVIATIATQNDEIIITEPYYFNHNMWLKMSGINTIYVDENELDSDPNTALNKLITVKTRAIIVVSPSNPTGKVFSNDVINEIAKISEANKIFFILDETYTHFRADSTPPHNIFNYIDEREYFIGLYSYSKELAIPGYRIGAIICCEKLIEEISKIHDCLIVCAPSISQEAALIGLTLCNDWRNMIRDKILTTQLEFKDMMAFYPGGFSLSSIGAFYAWVKHPFVEVNTDLIVKKLASIANIISIPGTVFTNRDNGFIRFSFVNLDSKRIQILKNNLDSIR